MPDFIKTIAGSGAGFLVFLVVAVWGGTASYISRLRRNKGKFSMVELVGEWTISGFAGVITAYFCQEFGASFMMTAAMAGIAGHMGGRAIFIIEQCVESRLKKTLDIEINNKQD